MRDVFIFAGQSNMGGATPMVLRGVGLVSNPGAPGDAPNYVPAYMQTAANEWTGSPVASIDTGTIYDYPTDSNALCLYNENTTGSADRIFDSWGSHIKETPIYPSGDLEDWSSFGLELSFLYRHLASFPNTPIAAIKHSLGGSSFSSDWLPANTGSNGTAEDKQQWTNLETMVTEATARLNTSDGAGNWRWAGLVWMHGENGAHTDSGIPANDNTYLADARAFFAAVRTLCGRADMPAVIGVIGDAWGWETTPNPYLVAYDGHGYRAVDYSIVAGGNSVNSTRRANALGGAVLRRATLRTLGGDENCTYWENDGYPSRPPVSLTAAENDLTGYHWGGPGTLAAGERAFNAYAAMVAPRRRLKIKVGDTHLRLQTGVI